MLLAGRMPARHLRADAASEPTRLLAGAAALYLAREPEPDAAVALDEAQRLAALLTPAVAAVEASQGTAVEAMFAFWQFLKPRVFAFYSMLVKTPVHEFNQRIVLIALLCIIDSDHIACRALKEKMETDKANEKLQRLTGQMEELRKQLQSANRLATTLQQELDNMRRWAADIQKWKGAMPPPPQGPDAAEQCTATLHPPTWEAEQQQQQQQQQDADMDVAGVPGLQPTAASDPLSLQPRDAPEAGVPEFAGPEACPADQDAAATLAAVAREAAAIEAGQQAQVSGAQEEEDDCSEDTSKEGGFRDRAGGGHMAMHGKRKRCHGSDDDYNSDNNDDYEPPFGEEWEEGHSDGGEITVAVGDRARAGSCGAQAEVADVACVCGSGAGGQARGAGRGHARGHHSGSDAAGGQ